MAALARFGRLKSSGDALSLCGRITTEIASPGDIPLAPRLEGTSKNQGAPRGSMTAFSIANQ